MIKALLSGITWKLIADAFAALLGRIDWPIIIERLVTRVVVAGLDKLASMNTNRLLTETVADFKNQLQADGLKKANE